MGTEKRKKRRQQNNLLVLKLLILVAAVLVIFEGKLIYTMFTHSKDSSAVTATADAGNANRSGTLETESEGNRPDSGVSTAADADTRTSIVDEPLAGLSAAANLSSVDTVEKPVEDDRISEYIDSPAVVKEQEVSVDDSFFADSVFIGDSRMMGFRNSSGITQGTFLTSVGLSTGAMSDQVIASSEGNISVYQGLSGRQYDKIYLMLGTNDLGYYPWDDFKPNFSNIIQQFHKLQPNAVIYVCSVIYVDESKTATSYNNNDNVRKVNGYQLEICEEEDYCYYLNLNEIFTNGYGSLLEDASSDGIHLYEQYCKQMLTYLKNHYVPEAADRSDAGKTENGETETAESEGSGTEAPETEE